MYIHISLSLSLSLYIYIYIHTVPLLNQHGLFHMIGAEFYDPYEENRDTKHYVCLNNN